MQTYFVVDDVIDEAGHEGFEVLFGNPFTAVGVSMQTCATLAAARRYVMGADGRDGSQARRVFLARRHGAHRVIALFPAESKPFPPFHDCGMWQARGYDAFGRHFNRAFRVQREAARFVAAMVRGEELPRY